MSMLHGNTGTPRPRVSIYAVQHCRNARRVLIPVSEGGTREDSGVGRNPVAERRVPCKTVLEVNDNSGEYQTD